MPTLSMNDLSVAQQLSCLQSFLDKETGDAGYHSTEKENQECVTESLKGKTSRWGDPLAVQYRTQYDLKYRSTEKGENVDQSCGSAGNGNRKQFFVRGEADGCNSS